MCRKLSRIKRWRTGCHRFFCGLVFFVLLMGGSVAVQAKDMVRGDYSGWSLEKAFGDLARKGELNLVGRFSETKIRRFYLGSETYIEEALSFLASSHDLVLRKKSGIWVVLPASQERDDLLPEGIVRKMTWRTPGSLAEPLLPLLPGGAILSFPPLTGSVVAAGPHRVLSELEKTMEMIEGPRHTRRWEVLFREEPERVVIASCAFPVLDGHSFEVSRTSPAASGISFNWSGASQGNDDGVICLTSRLQVRCGGERREFSGESITHGEWAEHEFEVGGRKYSCAYRAIFDRMDGLLAPDPVEIDTSQGNPSSRLEPMTPAAPGAPDSFVVISEHPAPSLKEPLVWENRPLTEILEKLAQQENISLLCDDSVGGTISVYCYADRLDMEDLLSAVAVGGGARAAKTEAGMVVGKATAIRDLDAAKVEPYQSRDLRRISAASGSLILQEIFRGADIAGTVDVRDGKRLFVQAERAGRSVAAALCENWEKPVSAVDLTLEAHSGGTVFPVSGKMSWSGALTKEWTAGKSRVKVKLAPLAGDEERGFRQVEFRLVVGEVGKEQFQVKSACGLPVEGVLPLFSGEGREAVQISLRGRFSPEPEEKIEAPLDDAF